VERWLERTNKSRGAVVDLETVWRLAKAWYADPRLAGWWPRTRDESQSVIGSVGLTGEFWELP
jgi:hypothetical protein